MADVYAGVNFRYKVLFGSDELKCSKVTGLEVDSDTIEYREGEPLLNSKRSCPEFIQRLMLL